MGRLPKDHGIAGVLGVKRDFTGNPKEGTQEYRRNMMEYNDPERYNPIIFLLYSWGSLFGVPTQTLLS